MPDEAQETPGDVLAYILDHARGHRSQAANAALAGLNPSTLINIRRSGRPTLETVQKIADGLKLEPELRRRWFKACGFPDAKAEPPLERIADAAKLLDWDPDLASREFVTPEVPPAWRQTMNRIARAAISQERRRTAAKEPA